jgi:2-oxoglutarate ferredoxin oxidoreductase subunit beta
MKTYGFHGLHGRALPVACGIRSRRPDLDIFVVTGDGDCCAIGTSHWIHAIRYNMDMTVLLLDNNIYGLTKAQTSPTTKRSEKSNTHPQGSFFVSLNPISVVLGITNCSFVAQTIDWNPPHLYATIRKAHEHKGTSFVRVLQRCPHYTSHIFAEAQRDASKVLLMDHEDGITLPDVAKKAFPNVIQHDPSNIDRGRELAGEEGEIFPIGLFYRNTKAERYDESMWRGIGTSHQDKINAVNDALDRFMI